MSIATGNKHAIKRLDKIQEDGWYFTSSALPGTWSEQWERGLIQWSAYHIYVGEHIVDSIRAISDEVAIRAAKEMFDEPFSITRLQSHEVEVYNGV